MALNCSLTPLSHTLILRRAICLSESHRGIKICDVICAQRYFYRGWADYKRGFGNLDGEFWLGLDKIHRLTKTMKNRLRVDLEDTAGKTAYAEYDMFAVTSERTKYQLSLGTYSGTFYLAVLLSNLFVTFLGDLNAMTFFR